MPSTLANVIQAHSKRRAIHTLRSVIERNVFHVLDGLYNLGLRKLKPVEIYTTLHNQLEFFALLDLRENPIDDLRLPLRSEATQDESLRIKDDVIADLRRRLDRADTERPRSGQN